VLFNGATRGALFDVACRAWPNGLVDAELLEFLRGECSRRT